MIAFALWFLAAFGFAFVVGHSKISQGLRWLIGGHDPDRRDFDQAREELRRELKDPPGPIPEELIAGRAIANSGPLIPHVGPWLAALAECAACLGWWLGFGAGASGLVELPITMPWWGAGLFLAFATSGVNLLLAKYVGIA